MKPGIFSPNTTEQTGTLRSRVQQLAYLMVLVLLLVLAHNANAADKPNIVYILVDNWGWGDISVQGSSVQTPNIDDLANQGHA
jgi:hypothetical protein